MVMVAAFDSTRTSSGLLWNCSLSFLMAGGQVAENSSVCLPPGDWETILVTTSSNPISSMRSASSSTSTFKPSSESVPLRKWSSTRPGVPTTI